VSLVVGDPAPDFALPTDRGGVFRLSSHRGRPVVLFFYPEDDTEGCTIENLEFSAAMPAFEAAGVAVAGISPDTVETHCRFRDKHRLAVPLLADPDRKVIGLYGVWGLKKLYGREYEGLIRTSVLIDTGGRIAAIQPARRIRGHAERMLEAARSLMAP
jgi:peroxiredoxin Q/BCP